MPLSKKRSAYLKAWRKKHKNYLQHWRREHVYETAYQTLKDNAKRRKIKFTISFAYFKKFAFETEYINKKGVTCTSLTVDRIRPKRGYVPGNIRAITMHNNVKIQRKLEFHLRQGKGYENFFRYTMPSFGDLTVVHL